MDWGRALLARTLARLGLAPEVAPAHRLSAAEWASIDARLSHAERALRHLTAEVWKDYVRGADDEYDGGRHAD